MSDFLARSDEDAPEAAARAAVTAALLALGATFDRVGLALILVAAGVRLAAPTAASAPFLAASVAAFGVQAWYGLRVRFDREIFAIWAVRWQTGGTTASPGDDMRAFDGLLRRVPPPGEDGTPPSLARRAAGARGLLKRQALALAAQCVLVSTAWLATPGATT